MKYHPLNRTPNTIDGDFLKNHTITGLPIYLEETNDSSYIVRYELNESSRLALSYLIREKQRSANEILPALVIIKDHFLTQWAHNIAITSAFGTDICYDQLTYRQWVILFDPIECIGDDLFDLLNVKYSWTWAEIYALITLWMIDESLASANMNDPYGSAIWLNRSTTFINWSWAAERGLNRAKSIASLGGIAKNAKDPKQHEKTNIVKECWEDWQKNPNRYNSDTAFANDMLTKCEHLVSHKKITDWCREWRNEN